MSEPTSTGVDARLASVLCYSGWWITGLVFLIVERQHRGVRFHAAQSVALFGTVSAVMLLLGAASAAALMVPGRAFQLLQTAGNVVWLGAAALWMVLLVRTWRGEAWRVPVIGAMAERIASR